MTKVPHEIMLEAIRQQELMGWPEMVPAWSEFTCGDGTRIFIAWEDLTVAHCEQLVEQHSRSARKAIERWMACHSSAVLRAAGYSIIRARLYRTQYFVLMGMKNTTEADMPFPCSAEDPDKAGDEPRETGKEEL